MLLIAILAMMMLHMLTPHVQNVARASTQAPDADVLIAEINAHRADHGLAPLIPLRSLALTADTSLEGLLGWDSPTREGITEVFAYGFSAEEAVDHAFTVPHRRARLLSPDITHIGVDSMVSPDETIHAVAHLTTIGAGSA